jgi:3-methylcrotonyl-CoA carboxylase alpha subunit
MQTRKISKILIANRGEIACRVIRTAKSLGLATVAVYSDADRDALHVSMADEAIHLGEALASASYLDAAKVIDAAKRSGADAVHPGYGFLSENADFARACEAADINFIGPPVEAILSMGSKSAAKRIMQAADVPLLPGYHGDDQDPDLLRAEANKIGYPVLLKAAAGGGGKGMRIVSTDAEFSEGLAAAQREAANAFGDELMLVEKYLEAPRHVEIQVFCDKHGNGVYLNERDCSVQRRHQKIIEEAPAPGLTAELRADMGEAALRCAQAIGYVGAGTVEFLLAADGQFYFMEMNTRLQVEHPVTEMITGFDLVEWQIRVASGEPLPATQEQIPLNGHAFEARIYAEDPDQDFLPQTGRLSFIETPAETANVRIDTGVIRGDEISIYYDPMISKLIVWDRDRLSALQRLRDALAGYHIGGVTTNVGFLYNLAGSAAFQNAELDTGFIEKHRTELFSADDRDTGFALAAAASYLILSNRGKADPNDPYSPWSGTDAWRLNEPHLQLLDVLLDDQEFGVAVEHTAQDVLEITSEFGSQRVQGAIEGDQLIVTVDGHTRQLTIAQDGSDQLLFGLGHAFRIRRSEPATGEEDAAVDEAGLQAPMNGTIVSLLVQVDEKVQAGASLLVMEAMKMEHTIKAPSAGYVSAFHFNPGDLVEGGASLLDFEPE